MTKRLESIKNTSYACLFPPGAIPAANPSVEDTQHTTSIKADRMIRVFMVIVNSSKDLYISCLAFVGSSSVSFLNLSSKRTKSHVREAKISQIFIGLDFIYLNSIDHS